MKDSDAKGLKSPMRKVSLVVLFLISSAFFLSVLAGFTGYLAYVLGYNTAVEDILVGNYGTVLYPEYRYGENEDFDDIILETVKNPDLLGEGTYVIDGESVHIDFLRPLFKDDFERKMYSGYKSGAVSIETFLLYLSGADTAEKINLYTKKLDNIEKQFEEYYMTIDPDDMRFDDDELNRADHLFQFLWVDWADEDFFELYVVADGETPSYKLTYVIDRWLTSQEKKDLGNCVGFTNLYTVMALRQDIDVKVAGNPDHVLSYVEKEGRGYEIDHVKMYGNLTESLDKRKVTTYRVSGLEDLIIANAAHAKEDLKPREQLQLFINLALLTDSPSAYAWLAYLFDFHSSESSWISARLIEKGKAIDPLSFEIARRECYWYETRCYEGNERYCYRGLKACSNALDLSGGAYYFYNARANIYYNLGEFRQSIYDRRAYVRQIPPLKHHEEMVAYNNIGITYLYDLGEYEKAAEKLCYARKIFLDQGKDVDGYSYGQISYDLAYADASLGRCNRVKELLEESIELGFIPDSGTFEDSSSALSGCIELREIYPEFSE